MGQVSFFLFLHLLIAGMVVSSSSQMQQAIRCPADYKRRVETCIMEAQMAPQAGGGLNLILNKVTVSDLCDRGLLRKTIDCLEEIRSRCAQNATVVQELDRLYSVINWEKGALLLCEDPDLFLANSECMAHASNSVMTCVLLRTHFFRAEVALADAQDHTKLREVTCNFAENVVNCVRGPLSDHCQLEIVSRLSDAMDLFLPPFCLAENYITKIPDTSTTEQPQI